MNRPKLALARLSILALLALIAMPGPLAARSESGAAECPVIVQRALATTDRLCDGTGRNQACYGHIALEAQPQPDVNDFVFVSEGDRAHVSDLQSLRLSQMDLLTGTWGIALLRLQAGLPDTAPDNVTIVLFGDVTLENRGQSLPEIPVQSTNPAGVNIRRLPDAASDGLIVGRLLPGEPAFAVGRLADSSWLYVRHPLSGHTGWILTRLLTVEGDLDTLTVFERDATYYGPMQAFTFQSAHDDAPCAEAPQSGLMIQTPEGSAKVTFLINEVDIQLGSTVFFQAEAGGELVVRVVEGGANVSAGGRTQIAPAGTEGAVPVDDELRPAGPPSPPQPYDMDDVAALPVTLLPREGVIAPPYTAGTSGTIPAVPGVSPAVPGTTTTDSSLSSDLPPGLIDNPGLDGELPPGQGGETPPGQTKKEK